MGNLGEEKETEIINGMWSNIGRTFAEYVFLKDFKFNKTNFDHIKINGTNYLNEVKNNNEPAIFYSGHFANFELMAMELDKFGIKCAAIYRPLNNFFLNPLMEYLRMKYICPNQIPKGRMGIREIISKVKDGYSIALMVDQRVSEGPRTLFFNKPAHTTTIPAQLALKYKCKLVPISLERKEGSNFEMTIYEPYKIKKNNKPVIFYSGHFANFELMAMELDKFRIKCAAIYRPLNNFFLNPLMEYLRMKYICSNQIPKGRMGMREIVTKVKDGYSIALMVDQRVSEGPRTLFFNKPAHTTTIPAQFALKYNCKLVPISLERKEGPNFEMTINEPYKIEKTGNDEEDSKNITLKINQIIEKMIIKNPKQWIWSHNRWK